ncbi:ATP-binding protein, partial [Nocardioides hankookensis]
RDYMTAMADLGVDRGDGTVDGPIPTADVAAHLARKPQSLSPARDGLIKKGLVYSGERGSVAFTVPHFGKFLRSRT